MMENQPKFIQTWVITGDVSNQDATWLTSTFRGQDIHIEFPKHEMSLVKGRSINYLRPMTVPMKISTASKEQVVWLKLYFGSRMYLLSEGYEL